MPNDFSAPAGDRSTRFSPGHIVATPHALEKLDNASILGAMARHVAGDWGEVSEEDRTANEIALKTGARLLSVYHDVSGVKFWIITEADRSSTCVLLPEDY